MLLDNLKENTSSLGNSDIEFFVKQIENLNNKTDIEIVFSGTISNGKSTLINALLNIDLLPMELGATTSLITTIQTGNNKIIALFEDGTSQNYELKKDSIKELSNKDDIETIQIFIKDFPYNGVKFVDTPGINDISNKREGQTFNYVPLADAVVFIVDASKGLTNEEKIFFDNKVVKANKDKIFIIVNKIDTIEEENIDISKLLSDTIVNDYKVYKISALKYLLGRLKADTHRVEESNIKDFKNDLDNYLLNLDKNRIFKERIEKSLENILKLATIQIDTLKENVSKDKPDIENNLLEVNLKIKESQQVQVILENEINASIIEIQKCIKENLFTLKSEIKSTINNVNHKEFMIDKFNDEVPLICENAMNNINICTDSKLKDLNIDFKELDELYLWIIRNIDDVLTNLVWVLTLVPQVNKFVTPFIPKVQDTIRTLVDMFSGQIIQNAVEDKIEELINLIEENINSSLSEYKSNLIRDYEHNQLGTIRSEILSLENLLAMNEYKKEEIEEKILYFQKSLDTLKNIIKTLLLENSK